MVTIGWRRPGARTRWQTTSRSARSRASALSCGSGRSGSGTPRKSKSTGRSSAKAGSSSSARPAIFSRTIRSGSRVGDAEVGAQHLQHRHEGDLAAVRLAPGIRRPRCRGARPLGELVAEAALADARLGDDADRGALAGHGPLQRLLEHGHLLVAADEAREAALAREVEPRAGAADPGQLEDAHRPARPLDLELAEILEREEAVRQLRRRLGQVGLAGLGQRLHPLRQADGVADRGVAALVRRRSRRRSPRPS